MSTMGESERQRIINEESKKYQREYMREYRQKPEYKEKAKQYRENWLFNRAMREIEDSE